MGPGADATGNRRYWPAMCTKVDADKLREDRDQLWAEAYHHFQNGELWWPQEGDNDLFQGEQDNRFDADVWEELVESWLRSTTKQSVLISDVMHEALKLQPGQMKPPEQKRVGQIMARLNWKKYRSRKGEDRETGYKRPADWKFKVVNEHVES